MISGEYIRQERNKKGLSLRDLAKEAKMSPAYLSQIERGLVTPKQKTMNKIIQALHKNDGEIWLLEHFIDNDKLVDKNDALPLMAVNVRPETFATFLVLDFFTLLTPPGEISLGSEMFAAILGFLTGIYNYLTSDITRAEITGKMLNIFSNISQSVFTFEAQKIQLKQILVEILGVIQDTDMELFMSRLESLNTSLKPFLPNIDDSKNDQLIAIMIDNFYLFLFQKSNKNCEDKGV